MSGSEQCLNRHSAPYAGRVKQHESFFSLFGGPLAWYLQLCAGYALASQPCFRDRHRVAVPLPALQWTWTAMVLAMIAAVALALLSLLVSWRVFRRTGEEAPEGSTQSIEASAGRTRFLALWGVFLGSAFALAAAITAVAFITLPRCAG
jgi:hypothetical protein